MVNLIRNKDYYGLSLFILLATFVGYQQMISPAIGIFILSVLIEGVFLKKLLFQRGKLNLLFILLFLYYVVSLLWSEHKDVGLKLLEYKMSFFIFPALFLFPKPSTNIWHVLQGFIFGGIILGIRIIYLGITTESIEPLFVVTNEVIFMHPTYVSMYYTFGIALLLYGYFSKKIQWNKIVIFSLLLFFLILIYIMNSLAAVLFILIVIYGWFVYYTHLKWSWKGSIGSAIVAPLLGIVILVSVPGFRSDMKVVTSAFSELSGGKLAYFEANKKLYDGNKLRMMIWIISTEVILENPFGVGLGDIDFHLNEKCDFYNLERLKIKKYNPHNQFLQIGIDIGFPGVVLLILIVISYLRFSIKNKNFLITLLISMLVFNGLFESVLQRQSGIVFFTVLITLIYTYRTSMKSGESVN